MQHISFLKKQSEYLKKIMESPLSFEHFINIINKDKMMGITSFSYEEMNRDIRRYHNVLNKITSIIYKPRINVVPIEEVVRSELASSMDLNALTETIKDTKLWKRKGSEMSPEYVHINKYDDSFVTYENSFIAFLVDILEKKLHECLSNIIPFSKSIEEEYGQSGLNFGKYSILKEFDMFQNSEVNVFKGNKVNTSEILKNITSGLKKIKNIKESQLYKFNKKKIKLKNIIPTNILLHESNYGYCYRFYLDNFLKEGEEFSRKLDIAYHNYVLVNMLRQLASYMQDKDKMSLSLDKEGILKFDFMKLKINHFLLDVKSSESDLSFIFKVKLQENESLYKVKTSYKLDNQNSNILNNEEDYIDTILICQNNTISHFDRVVNVSIYSKDNLNKIKSLLSSFMLLSLDELNSYENRCPVCGKKRIINNGSNKICESCKSIYSNIVIKENPYIWIKSLRRKK